MIPHLFTQLAALLFLQDNSLIPVDSTHHVAGMCDFFSHFQRDQFFLSKNAQLTNCILHNTTGERISSPNLNMKTATVSSFED